MLEMATCCDAQNLLLRCSLAWLRGVGETAELLEEQLFVSCFMDSYLGQLHSHAKAHAHTHSLHGSLHNTGLKQFQDCSSLYGTLRSEFLLVTECTVLTIK